MLEEIAPQADSKSSHAVSEQAIRTDLAACYRLAAHFRMTDMTYTHISARLDGGEEFLLNAFGLLFEEVCASNLVKVSASGEILEDPMGVGINAAGFVIHSAVHAARPDVRCVMHTHTAAGMAVSTHPEGLLPLTQHAMRFHSRLARHAYEGIAIDLAERERLAKDLGEHNAMILENHGLLTCGRTVAEAFGTMYYLERACQAQVAALGSGVKPLMPSRDAIEKTSNLFHQNRGKADQRDWPPLLRMLDRIDPSFRN
ncbi:class II aldolase/adducin family protein [Variovorax sp. Root411]|uniref:class II aldolase/adducin family protein n=1 Tax=Variovorax sp. Root411 TaxID=1736530 RepID=UPI0009E96B85|nr:class II aldolase/adducin family protein [Variovorax sp. Root411]